MDVNEFARAVFNNEGIENSNANVDEKSFSGKNAKITSKILKEYALECLIDKDVAEAHREGSLYIHDLDNYASGMHNCLLIDFQDLFDNNNGFSTRNGDVRKPNDIMTFFQLVAVVFQCESQVQFGGVGANKIDYDGAPYVAITFRKAFKEALMDIDFYSEDEAEKIMNSFIGGCRLGNGDVMGRFPYVYEVAKAHTIKKTMQGAESLYHNLNTLESRAGSQVPFTSINFGTDVSEEGRLVSECLLKASIAGIGKFNTTSIFPIAIFKHKKGINAELGDPNYDLKQLAIKSLSKRIYPNFANLDASYLEKAENPDEEFCTMGCRTLIGKDRHGLGNAKGGRGNIAPVTINLADVAIKSKNIEEFWGNLEEILKLAEKALIDRYEHIAHQKAGSGYFLHENKLMKNSCGRKLKQNEEVRESLKHNTLAIGYIGVAEMCKILLGNTHTETISRNFATKVIERIYNFSKEASQRNDLNFSCYATPAESTCTTLIDIMRKKYGIIEGVTDKEYLTNSHHIPVDEKVSIYQKILYEKPFQRFANGGCITYIELDTALVQNLNAVEKIINYAMENDIAYFAINFPIDTCQECGYSGEIKNACPVCNSTDIKCLRRVTGYLTTDYRKFNKGKIQEVKDRIKHPDVGVQK